MKPLTLIALALGIASVKAGAPAILSGPSYLSAPVPVQQYAYGAPAIAVAAPAVVKVGRVIQRFSATPPIFSTPIASPLAIPPPPSVAVTRVVEQPQVIAQQVVQQVAVPQPQLLAHPAPVVQHLVSQPQQIYAASGVPQLLAHPVNHFIDDPSLHVPQLLATPVNHVVSSPQVVTQQIVAAPAPVSLSAPVAVHGPQVATAAIGGYYHK